MLESPGSMRWLVLSSLLAVAGCPQGVGGIAANDDEVDPNAPPSTRGCVDDSDCQLASRTCCACPTFALPMSDPKLDACGDVDCPPPDGTCSQIRAACDRGACVVACEPQPVTKSCATGFATDGAGCLIDQCAQPASECMQASDCVRTRADCCGCARGGDDTAVPLASRQGHDLALGCKGSELCPEVNTCDAAETAQCAQGECRLFAGGLPADACGRPDLAPCGAGKACIVNASDPANMHGVGVCR